MQNVAVYEIKPMKHSRKIGMYLSSSMLHSISGSTRRNVLVLSSAPGAVQFQAVRIFLTKNDDMNTKELVAIVTICLSITCAGVLPPCSALNCSSSWRLANSFLMAA